MKKKILFTATVWIFFDFLKHDIRMLHDNGWEVHAATNFNHINKPIEVDDIVVKHQIDFSRSPLGRDNIKAYRQLRKLLREEHFDIIHCHTVIASVLTRIAAKKYRRQGTKVFYTAHGFNFYKGAPKSNWLLFFPVEWALSWITDLQLTINTEDYRLAKNHLHAKETRYIPGVGIDLERFCRGTADIEAKRAELNAGEDDIVILCVGEYSARKNQAVLIRALAELGRKDVKLYLAGNGKLEEEYKSLALSLGIENQVKVLGYRTDISELCQAADVFSLPSHYEGLSVALMEAVACETPVICSHIRGSEDIITDKTWMFNQRDVKSVAACLNDKIGGRTRAEFAEFAAPTVRKNRENLNSFDLPSVERKMREVYGIDG